MTHIVLVHGAWAGGWVWDGLSPLLSNAGHHPHVVDLPGVGRWDDTEVTLDHVVGHVVDLVSALDSPAVLVGHSGGGVVVTQAAEAAAEHIAGVVYVAGMMLPSGTDFAMLCSDLGLPGDVGISRWLEPTSDGRGTRVPPEAAAAVFFHESSAEHAISAARRLRPQLESARHIAPTWTRERFGSLPRLYIETALDRTLPIAAQRHMQRLVPGAVVGTLVSDHAPQLSAADQLCDALSDFAHGVGR
ncbi:alpha/beta fold hydrolase [Dietzia sp. PP-33]|uniref:alpha/beta fold hydrolase n=1 Tax=Dietzia sp. PP-33 TaxID=2957500 RepID=UPI0029B0D157|nr:alpha/beta fold hydrolase [Dietzia sp. PP-33]MDX2358506.1 alpha/beta fold hydrolase [Dietzia sp. PP-33]